MRAEIYVCAPCGQELLLLPCASTPRQGWVRSVCVCVCGLQQGHTTPPSFPLPPSPLSRPPPCCIPPYPHPRPRQAPHGQNGSIICAVVDSGGGGRRAGMEGRTDRVRERTTGPRRKTLIKQKVCTQALEKTETELKSHLYKFLQQFFYFRPLVPSD